MQTCIGNKGLFIFPYLNPCVQNLAREVHSSFDYTTGTRPHLLHLSTSLDVARISFLVLMTSSSTSAPISSLTTPGKNTRNLNEKNTSQEPNSSNL